MLDMGFIPDIERIIKLLPASPKDAADPRRSRQTLFFSATMPKEIQRLVENFLTEPVRVEVSRPASTVKTVAQHLVKAGREPAEKRAILRGLIRGATDLKNAIIFCNRKRDVATLARSLIRHGFAAGALHGDMSQPARTAMLESFRKGQLPILVASDVAARGLDIQDVSHIFNFDVPTHAEDYVHRIGRTGRAGRAGTAITLATPLDTKYVVAIEKLTGDSVGWLAAPGDVEASPADAAEAGEAGGRRRSGRANGRGRGRSTEARKPQPQLRAKTDAPSIQPDIIEPVRAGRGGPRRDERPDREPRPERDRRRRDNRPERDEQVVGLGDHVPQFLLRPVRLPSSS
jgi:superfamily II DNA/RNA helicase